MRARILVRMPERLQLRVQRLSSRTAAPSTLPGRPLQLALATLWLLNALLQTQSMMFTPAFAKMLAASAAGNPRPVAVPIEWSARIIGQHPGPCNAAFAAAQLLIAAGIAYRPTIRLALASSVVWSLGVWWLGEGLGGVMTPTASPVTGAPGAVILYALLAVLLWPADRDPDAPFAAGHAIGRRAARAAWVVLWCGMAVLALVSADRVHDSLAGMATGEPGWLAASSGFAAGLVTGHGGPAAFVMAGVCMLAGAAVLVPARAGRVLLVAVIAVAVVIWVAGEDLGGLFTGMATDPNSGPLLMLLALAYWPVAPSCPRAQWA